MQYRGSGRLAQALGPMTRICVGPLPQSPEFHPRELGWVQLREGSPMRAQLTAFPIGIGILGLLYFAWVTWAPAAVILPDSVLGRLGALFCVIVVHELLHAVAHPGLGLSSDTCLGFWPKQATCYAHYVGAMPRNRLIVVLLLPLLLISLAPLLLSIALSMPIPYGAFVSPANGLLACVDVLGVGLLAVQVPPSAVVRNQGWVTWWHGA